MSQGMDKRAEGFRGQRLFRLPVDLKRLARKHVLVRDLYITDIGYFPESRDHMVERPAGAENSILIYGVSGSGWIQVNQKRFPVPPEHALLIPAGVAHSYGADSAIPWSIHWAHFAGRRVEAYLAQLGVLDQAQQLYVPHPELIAYAFESCERFLGSGAGEAQLLSASTAFAHLLSLLHLYQRSPRRRARSSEDRIVQSISNMKKKPD